MSLFNFIKSFLEENPDLNIVNDFTNPLEYSALYDIFRNRVKDSFKISKKDLK